MSYASARTTELSELKSVNIGSIIQEQSLVVTLVSGVLAPLVSYNYPDGLWTGWADIEVKGDNTTAFSYLNVIEDNEGGNTNQQASYFVGSTLPSNVSFYIKYPITKATFSNSNNEIILSAQAVFTGTAPTIQVTYLYIVKVG